MPAPVMAMPRLASIVNPAVVCNVPPLNTILPGVALPSTAPSARSAAICNVPPLRIVPAVELLTPDRITVPAPELSVVEPVYKLLAESVVVLVLLTITLPVPVAIGSLTVIALLPLSVRV